MKERVGTKGIEKKEEILQAGLEVMYDKGYNGTSVRDIVEAAGVPKGSFYFYFDSKEDFALEAMEHYFSHSGQMLDKVLLSPTKTAKDRLLAFYELRIRHNVEVLQCERGCFVNNIASEMSGVSSVMRTRVNALMKKSVEQIAGVISEAQKKGQLDTRMDSVKLASAIEDAWKGALVTMKSCKCQDPLDDFRDIILRNLLV